MKIGIKSSILFVFFISLFVALLVFFSSTIFNSSEQFISASIFLYSLGKLSGLIGLLFLSILIISGDCARFFDRYFGMDKVIKFQRKFALATLIFVLLHPIFFVLSNRVFFIYLIPSFSAVPLALGTISLYMLILIYIASIFYKRISYCAWQYIHIFTYILFFFSFYHAINVGSNANNPAVRMIFYGLLAVLIAGIIYRLGYKIKQGRFKCYVKEIKRESNNVFTLVLKTNKKLNFKPGQFCFLRLNKKRLYARHPFTISSSPDEETLSFTIKLAGKFTRIASQLEKGEEVIVEGPFGIFNSEEDKRAVFIAGGVGITPFASMIKNQRYFKLHRDIMLLYCAKTKGDLIFKEYFDSIDESWFIKKYILSRENLQSEGYEYGRINGQIISKYIQNFGESVFYICGPGSFNRDVSKILRDLGVAPKNIRIESFFW